MDNRLTRMRYFDTGDAADLSNYQRRRLRRALQENAEPEVMQVQEQDIENMEVSSLFQPNSNTILFSITRFEVNNGAI